MVSRQEMSDYVEEVRRSTAADFEIKLTAQRTELDGKIMVLTGQLNQHWKDMQSNIKMELDKKMEKGHQTLTSRKNFASLSKYSGKSEEYDDWKFQVATYLSEDEGYHELIIHLEKFLKPPTKEDMLDIFTELNVKFPSLSMEVMNKELYQFLCLNLKDKALGTVKNLFSTPHVNGFVAWWKLGYENNAMTMQRMQAITNRVLSPKRCKRYSEVSAALEEWEYALSIYERVEGNKLSEQARIFSVKRVVPEELQDDVNRLNNLDSFEKVKAYIVEQVLVRRDVKNSSTGPVAMDVDMMTKMIASLEEHHGQCQDEQAYDEDRMENKEDDLECKECDGSPEGLFNKLFSMVKGQKGKSKGKGKGKGGKFDGYCNKCGKYGHKATDCWSGPGAKGFGKNQEKGQGNWYGGYGKSPKGKGKGAYGLMWDLAGANKTDWQSQGSGKSPWTLSLTKVPATPPGLKDQYVEKNLFEILSCSELEDESKYEAEMKKNFPKVNEIEKNCKKMRMPRIGNYSKNSIRKQLNIFIKEPIRNAPEKTLDPFVSRQSDDGWLQVKGVMDSGASESVAPPDLAPHYPVTSSPGSLSGQEYTSASGNAIPNLGEKILDIVMEDGRESQIKYQVAEVSRPLNSISEICDAGGNYGQIVMFGRTGGAILNLETGIQTPFAREEGVYTMDVWVKPKGFHRQG